MGTSHPQGLLKVVVLVIAPKEVESQVPLFVPREVHVFRPQPGEENSLD